MFLVSRQQLDVFDKHVVLKYRNTCEGGEVQNPTTQHSEETDTELLMRKYGMEGADQ